MASASRGDGVREEGGPILHQRHALRLEIEPSLAGPLQEEIQPRRPPGHLVFEQPPPAELLQGTLRQCVTDEQVGDRRIHAHPLALRVGSGRLHDHGREACPAARGGLFGSETHSGSRSKQLLQPSGVGKVSDHLLASVVREGRMDDEAVGSMQETGGDEGGAPPTGDFDHRASSLRISGPPPATRASGRVSAPARSPHPVRRG